MFGSLSQLGGAAVAGMLDEEGDNGEGGRRGRRRAAWQGTGDAGGGAWRRCFPDLVWH